MVVFTRRLETRRRTCKGRRILRERLSLQEPGSSTPLPITQYGGGSQNYKILEPGHDEDISTVNGSMYLVPDAVEGLVLFEHNFYGGERKVTF